jgi:hypothetical protein
MVIRRGGPCVRPILRATMKVAPTTAGVVRRAHIPYGDVIRGGKAGVVVSLSNHRGGVPYAALRGYSASTMCFAI